METSVSFNIDINHPSIAGHFPNNPIVPGVVILDLLIVALKNKLENNLCLESISVLKFLHTVSPGETLDVKFRVEKNGQIYFDGYTHNGKVVTGRALLSNVDASL